MAVKVEKLMHVVFVMVHLLLYFCHQIFRHISKARENLLDLMAETKVLVSYAFRNPKEATPAVRPRILSLTSGDPALWYVGNQLTVSLEECLRLFEWETKKTVSF
jgi:hypothetical protein